MTFTENAKAHARAELGMGDDEPNAATGATGHAEFEWIASIFDSGFEAGRREGAETALKYAADNIVFSDEWRNHGNNDPRLDGEAEASAWLEVEASRPLPLTAGDFTETGTPDA